jgi:hypothetical protein
MDIHPDPIDPKSGEEKKMSVEGPDVTKSFEFGVRDITFVYRLLPAYDNYPKT